MASMHQGCQVAKQGACTIPRPRGWLSVCCTEEQPCPPGQWMAEPQLADKRYLHMNKLDGCAAPPLASEAAGGGAGA